MIISRTPFRISFFGGGTDYPVWYNKNNGCVISSTINQYSFVTVRYLPNFFDYKYRIRYYQDEKTKTIEEIKHPSVRETVRYLELKKGLEIVHNADLPAQSGLGSSSTFTVGLLNALNSLKGNMSTKRELALGAINIEQNMIGESVGSQDQTAAAFGGLNRITFNAENKLDVEPIITSKEKLDELQDNLMLFFTGFSRSASSIAKKQIELTHKREKELNLMTDICNEGLNVLTDNNKPIYEIGRLLDEQWKIKREMTDKISNQAIDKIYQAGIDAGATGGKLLGAGGGGFMLFFVPKSKQNKVMEALKSKLNVPFRFEYSGSKIVYYSH